MSPRPKRRSAEAARSARPPVYFGSVAVRQPEADCSLPAKLGRILKKFDLAKLSQGAWVPIKMHLGGELGFTTIHPVFVRVVAQAIKAAGGKPFVLDATMGAVESAAARGYTPETIGCPIVSAGGPYDRYVVPRRIGYRTLDRVNVLGAIWDAPCLINLSHVKGHGCCGYGGACKNIAMGCVDGPTRGKIHALEGGIDWIARRCTRCGRCVKACDTGAISLDAGSKEIEIFYHNCRYCRHCISACPKHALTMRNENGYEHFQEGMARTTRAVLDSFDAARVLYINLLVNITMFCDCWGFSSPSVVPDVGVLASQDIVAIESASLDLIQADRFIPGSLIGSRQLQDGKHLFERMHGKDPFVQLRALERHGCGRSDYALVEVS